VFRAVAEDGAVRVGEPVRDSHPVSERPGCVMATAGGAAFRRLEDDRLKPALRTVAPLDIEPVDLRAGGYTWTDADGSVAIVEGQPCPALSEKSVAEALRDQIFGDEQMEFSPLEALLTDLADDIGSAWR